MATWWTSDLHLGHANIITYCRRPFADVDEMNEALVARWNAVVAPEDTVYVLGDFSFAPPALFFDRLLGAKTLVMGNHDERRRSQVKRLPWARWEPQCLRVEIEGRRVYMSHHPTDAVEDYDLYLHGHCHGTRQPAGTLCDVGVDCWDFRPCSLNQILGRIASYA